MKKIIYALLCLFLISFSAHSQRMKSYKYNFSHIQYPIEPLKGNSIKIEVSNLDAAAQYGIDMKMINTLFDKMVNIDCVESNDAYYTLKLRFENPKVKNEGIKSYKKGENVYYYARFLVDFPIYMELKNSTGGYIYLYHKASSPIYFYGPKKGSRLEAIAAMAKKREESDIRFENECVQSILKDFVNDFVTKHSISQKEEKIELMYLKTTKKYKDEEFFKMHEKLKEITLKMKPGESLSDYKDEVKPILDYNIEKFDQCDVSKKRNYLIAVCHAEYAMFLKALLYDYDDIEKFYVITDYRRRYQYVINKFNKFKRKYLPGYEVFEQNITIDDKQVAKNKEIYIKDSLKNKPSYATIYYSNHKMDVLADIGYIRPYIDHSSNIVDLDYGCFLSVCDGSKPQRKKEISRVSADEVVKVVAGDEVYYPITFANKKRKRFTLLMDETEKIKMFRFKDRVILFKNNNKETIDIAFPSIIFPKKGLMNFFADNPELAKKIKKKKVDYKTISGLKEIIRMY